MGLTSPWPLPFKFNQVWGDLEHEVGMEDGYPLQLT